ncbi:MAG: acetyl-CoA carboxylase biotin carboxylase subunit [Myxococcota bacterium]
MRLLIANRGEIAVRIARTAREAGHVTVAVHSDADARAAHVLACDEAVSIGEPMAYLDVPRLVEAAKGCDAIHPGYGFLSENAGFARAVIDAGFRWIGPSPEAIAAMGDKMGARRRMRAAGVPVVPGVESEDAAEIAALGFPLMVKAAGGGGGRGLRVVEDEAALHDALAEARAEAGAAFGDARVYAERRILRPRHVEVQVLGDTHGNVVHLGERECSIQRRHQKVVEETPSTALTPALREAMCDAAVRAAKAVDYVGAGTIEFLLDGDRYYFLEMNTRIQVEHPITEAVRGIDLVRAQLDVATGGKVPHVPEARGHAIECRVVAEDPRRDWAPSPGRIARWRPPSGPGVRVDAGVVEGSEVPVFYDPLLAKLVVWAEDRPAAIARMLRALSEFVVLGVDTNLENLHDVVASEAFAAGDTHTDFLARFAWQPPEVDAAAFVAAWKAAPASPAATSRTTEASPWSTLGRWP